MSGKNPMMCMLRTKQKNMPPVENTMFKVSVKLHSSVALWVAIVPHPVKEFVSKTEVEKKNIKDTEQQITRVLPLLRIVGRRVAL